MWCQKFFIAFINEVNASQSCEFVDTWHAASQNSISYFLFYFMPRMSSVEHYILIKGFFFFIRYVLYQQRILKTLFYLTFKLNRE